MLRIYLGALLHEAEFVRSELSAVVDAQSCRAAAAVTLQVAERVDLLYRFVLECVVPYPQALGCVMERDEQIRKYLNALRQKLDLLRKGSANEVELNDVRFLSSSLESLFTEIKVLLEANFL